MKTHIILFLALLAFFVVPATAGPPEKVEAFVCPVLGGNAGMNGNSEVLINITDGNPESFYTRVGPDVYVPIHATNRVNGNAGRVHLLPHASPGDVGYTAIWSKEN